jgi:hypothetical protein
VGAWQETFLVDGFFCCFWGLARWCAIVDHTVLTEDARIVIHQQDTGINLRRQLVGKQNNHP